MAWIYLVESEALQSPSKNGLDHLPIAKSINIAKDFSSPEWPLRIWSKLQYGMIYGVSNLLFSKDQSTSSTEAFHARISALQDAEKAWKENEAGYFSRSCAWPKKSSPNSYSLKTSQPSQAEGDFESLEKLPKWGMIVDGVLYPLKALERHMFERGSFFLPTPCARDVRIGKRKDRSKLRKGQLCEQIGRLRESDYGRKLCPLWIEQLMGYPTEWIKLEPLETQSCPPKLEKLFASCRALLKIE